jgi:hypothetical protein
LSVYSFSMIGPSSGPVRLDPAHALVAPAPGRAPPVSLPIARSQPNHAELHTRVTHALREADEWIPFSSTDEKVQGRHALGLGARLVDLRSLTK